MPQTMSLWIAPLAMVTQASLRHPTPVFIMTALLVVHKIHSGKLWESCPDAVGAGTARACGGEHPG